MSSKRAVVTISALNYLGRVEVVRNSFKKYHPDIPFYHFIIDDFDGSQTKKILKKTQNCIFLKGLIEFFSKRGAHVSLKNILFQYDIVEASTALKPFILMQMLEDFGFEEVLYLDPDLMFFNNIHSVWDQFTTANVLLTPHLVKLNNVVLGVTSEYYILKSGIFNLGFLGIKKSEEVTDFLAWWGERLLHFCSNDISRGFFTDQKWIDIAISALPGFKILRDPGLNLAFWNMHERTVWQKKTGEFRVDDESLKFFHFSGFEAQVTNQLSKHRTQLKLSELGVVKDLAKLYRAELKKYQHARFSKIKYGLDYFSNGVKIPWFLRKWMILRNDIIYYDDLFDVAGRPSFFNWLLKSSSNSLCPLADMLRSSRPDLIAEFPDEYTSTPKRFSYWLAKYGLKEFNLDPKFQKFLKLKNTT